MAGRHKTLNSPYTKLVLCVYISTLVAIHRFPASVFPIITHALISGLDWKQGFNVFALWVLTEKGWLPQVLWCPISGRWRCPPVSQAKEQRAEPKLQQLLLELSGCRQLVGLVNMCYFPMDQLSAAVMRRSDLFSLSFLFFKSLFFSFSPLACSRSSSL